MAIFPKVKASCRARLNEWNNLKKKFNLFKVIFA